MLDSFIYPQGDIQTWDKKSGEEIEHDIPESLRDFLSKTNDEFHLTKWMPSLDQLMREEALMLTGLLPNDEEYLNPENRVVMRLRDKISGFTFQAKEPLELNYQNPLPEDKELLNAAIARAALHTKSRDGLIKTLRNKENWKQVFNFPIKEYEAKDINQIEGILKEVSYNTSYSGSPNKIWLRGQRQEFPFHRTEEAIKKLPFKDIANDFPSLVPSIGRYALKNPGKVDLAYAFTGPNHWWKKPFLIWFIRQNPNWLKHYPEYYQKLNIALEDESDIAFRKLLGEMPIDPLVPIEVDDLRQWFFAHSKYDAWIWALQQYGYYASMLDVTWDIDTALFFSQAQMIDSKFYLPEPSDERVIYVFVEMKNSTSFTDATRVDWGDSDWNPQIPLRVERQRAGCLIGSTWFRQNYYGHLVVAKIRLTRNCLTTRAVTDVFPSAEEDTLLKTLLESKPKPEGLYY